MQKGRVNGRTTGKMRLMTLPPHLLHTPPDRCASRMEQAKSDFETLDGALAKNKKKLKKGYDSKRREPNTAL